MGAKAMPLPTGDEAAIAALYSQMHLAMVAADITALAALLTADFHLVHMTGYDQPRAEWLAHIASGRMRYFSSTQERVVVRVDGDNAQLRGRNRVKADIWGTRGTWPLQLDIGLVRRDGRWWMSTARASTY
jgi:ketosteroid isomerase-like protein